MREKKIKQQQQSFMMDQVCELLFGVGLYSQPTHPFTNWMNSQGIDTVSTLAALQDQETFQAMGYDIPPLLLTKCKVFGAWYDLNVRATGLNELMQVTGLEEDEFNQLLDDTIRPQGAPKSHVEGVVDPFDTPAAGPYSNAAALAHRRKTVSFGNVTGRIGARNSHGADPPQPHPTPLKQPPSGSQPPYVPPGVTTTSATASSGQPITVCFPPSSKASNFEKGGRRSVSDYDKLSSKEQWPKWQRATLGTAFEHKVEQVLDPQYTPDPSDLDEVELFANQQRFMYSVFTKCLTEGKAVDILRNYSNPKDTNFGDAQAIYSDLCDYFEGGAQARVSAASLETQLTTIRLNRQWTKTVRAFVTKVSHLIRDHKEITKRSHDDKYYIEKLKNTFSEHKDMASHLRTLETQDAMFTRRFGAVNGAMVADMTYEQLLFEVSEYATTLDERYAKLQKNRRETNNTQRETNAATTNGNHWRPTAYDASLDSSNS
jgi:hypothetical protein